MKFYKPGLLFDNRFFDHAISGHSVENPDRLRHLYIQLEKSEWACRYKRIRPREAEMSDILAVHSSFYIDQIREYALKDDPYAYDNDTYLMDQTFYTARLAAGGCLELADQIMKSEMDYGFAIIRPPGHHAEPGRGMGFCVLNHIAITAQYLRKHYGLQRILIVDFDVHHCNGTQAAFYDSKNVLVFSVHQDRIFPFTGSANEVGVDEGKGYTVNLPVPAQFGDTEYRYLLGRVVNTLAEQYLPQIILVSAGYDAHKDDSMSNTLLTTEWFGLVTEMLKTLAADYCDNRLLLVLEGGYNPESLESSVLRTVDVLCSPAGVRVGIAPSSRAEAVLDGHPLHHFWTL